MPSTVLGLAMWTAGTVSIFLRILPARSSREQREKVGASVNPAWGGNQLMEWLQKSNLSGRLSQLVSKLVDRKLLGHRQGLWNGLGGEAYKMGHFGISR